MPDKKCPHCGLWNSESAPTCDCGYDLPLPPEEEIPAEEAGEDVEEEELPDIKCPKCGLWNAGTAFACDCGFDFTQMPKAEKPAAQTEFPMPPDTTLPLGKLPPISTFSDQACIGWVRDLFKLAFRPNEQTIREISEDSGDAEWSAAFMFLFLALLFPIIQFVYSFLKTGSSFSGCVSCLVSRVLSSVFASWLPVLAFSVLFAMALRRNQPETKIFLHNSLYFGTLTASLLSIILGIFTLISIPLMDSDWFTNSILTPAIGIAILLLLLAGVVYLMFIAFRIIRALASPEERKRARRIALCAIAVLLAVLLNEVSKLFFPQGLITLLPSSQFIFGLIYLPSLYYLFWIAATAWMIRKTSIPVLGWLLVSIVGLLAAQILTRWFDNSIFVYLSRSNDPYAISFVNGIPAVARFTLFAGIQWLYLRRYVKHSRLGSVWWPLGFILAHALPLKPFLGCPTELSLLAQYGLPGVLLVYWFPPDDPASWARPGQDWFDHSFKKLRAFIDLAWNNPFGKE